MNNVPGVVIFNQYCNWAYSRLHTLWSRVNLCLQRSPWAFSVILFKTENVVGSSPRVRSTGTYEGPDSDTPMTLIARPKTFTRSFRLLFFSIAKRNGNNRCRGRQGKATRSRDLFAVPLRVIARLATCLGQSTSLRPEKTNSGFGCPLWRRPALVPGIWLAGWQVWWHSPGWHSVPLLLRAH